MGFGLLFIGYFFMLNLPIGGVDILPDILGCFIMLAGLNSLIFYCHGNRGFIYSRLVLVIFAVLSIAILGCQLAAASGMLTAALESYFYKPLSIVYSVVIGIFHILIFIGIFQLAGEVGLPKISNRARHMLVLTVLYYACELLAAFGLTEVIASASPTPDAVLSYINLVIYVLGSIWLVLTWALIFTCYMRICLEGDEDMPYRENTHDRIISYLKSKKKKR